MIRISELGALCCRDNLPLHDALARLNATPQLFQVVLDRDGRVAGTLTDGDVRRALLTGVTLDAPVARAMHTPAVLGTVDDAAGNLARLRRIGANTRFLPIVDPERRPVEILVAGPRDEEPGLALVMAGGYGRRLGERTRAVPKPLLPVGGRPMLDHVLDAVMAAGFGRIFVAVHYLAERIEQHLSGRPDAARIETLHEDTPLGTAGAVAMVPGRERENLLVINADLLTRLDLATLLSFHSQHGHDATIATACYDTQIPFGVVRHDDHGNVQAIDEKPVTRHFVLAGIYYLTPAVSALVAPSQRQDMPEIINRAGSVGLSIGMFPLYEYWRDIGHPADLERAESDHPTWPSPATDLVAGSSARDEP